MTTSPMLSKLSAATTFIASLSMTSWPRTQVVELDAGAHGDPQLAAAGEDVDGAVVVAGEEDAEAGRRLGQPVDLFLERHDLVTRLLEGGDQALVLGGDRGEVGLQVADPLFERAQVAGRLGESAAQGVDLVLQRADLRVQVGGRTRLTASSVVWSDGPWTTRRHLPSGRSRSTVASRSLPTLPSAGLQANLHYCVSFDRFSDRTAPARHRFGRPRPRSHPRAVTPLAGRRRRSGGATPSASRRVVTQEPGVPDHPVLRPDGETLEVPAADQRLPGRSAR